MDQRGAATDNLGDVIRIAQFVRKSGTLLVERGEVGTTFEEGSITFVEGQVTDARAGQRYGAGAFNWLQTWGSCRFTFIPLQSSPSQPTRSMADRSTGRLHTPPTPNTIVPYPIRDAREVLPLFGSMRLTRTHRQLFLLIDGQRSIPELIRLFARGDGEVYALLADLERAGLIRR